MATQVANLYARVGADVSGFSKAMSGVDDKLNSVGSAFGALGGAIKTGVTIAAGAAAVAVAGLTTAVVTSTMAAADMEQQIANIAAVMGLTAEESSKVGELINQLGVDPKLKVSAVEAGQAIEMLAKNGLTLDQILNGAARSTVLLANSTGADFASAADTATSAMIQFGIKAEDMGAAVDGIVGVTVASKFGFEDYSLALAQAGGVAASVGVSFDDFNATIAAISPLFASGSDAGTSFKTFLQRLIPQSKDAKKRMQELGLMTEEGANQFFDASGKMKSMAEVAGMLNKAFAGLSEEQKNEAASTIFGTDAMRAAFALASMTTDQFNAMKTTIGNTNAEEAAATRMDTLSGKMEILRGIIEANAISIGQQFLPLARNMADWAVAMATQYGPQVVAWFQQLAVVLSNVWAYLVTVAQGGDAMNDWLTHLPTAIQPAVQAIGEVVGAIGRIWQAFQQGGISGGLSQIGVELQALGKTIAGWAGGLWNDFIKPGITESFGNFTAWITNPDTVKGIAEKLIEWGKAFWGWSGDMWNKYIYPNVLQGWTDFSTWITNPATWMQFWKDLQTWGGVFAIWSSEIWSKNIWPNMQALWDNFAGPGGWIEKNKPELKPWVDAMAAFPGNVKTEWDKQFPQLKTDFSTWKTNMGTELDKLVEIWSQVFGDGKETGTIGDAAKTTVDVVNGMFRGMMTGSLELVKWAQNVGQVVMMLKQMFDAIERRDWGAAGDLFNKIGNIPIAPGWFNNPYNPLTGDIHNMPTDPWNSQGVTPVTGGTGSRVDLYLHNGSGLPADREGLRQLAVALRKELDLTGAVMVR